MKNSKYSNLLHNTFLFAISSFGSKLLFFFLTPLYTNVLTPKDYGVAELVFTTSTLLIFILTLNISDGVCRFSFDPNSNRLGILAYGIRIALMGTLILILGVVCLWFFDVLKPDKFIVFFIVFQFLGSAFYQIIISHLRAVGKINVVAISGVFMTICSVIFSIIFLIFLKWGIYGYLISIIASNYVAAFYCISSIGKIRIREKVDNALKREMILYSVPLVFNGIAWWMNDSIDKYFVTLYCGVALNGVYSISQKIPTILSTLQSIFAQSWNLSAVKEYDEHDEDNFFENSYKIYNAFLVLFCSLLILFNIILAKVLFAKEFFEAWKYSSILVVSVVFSALSSFLGSIFSAVKKSNVTASSTIVAAFINVLLNIIFLPRIGVLGAAAATLISFFSLWLIRLFLIRKYIIWQLNIKRDVVAYVLLIVQTVFEHMNPYSYLWQIGILFLLLILYKDELLILMKNFVN